MLKTENQIKTYSNEGLIESDKVIKFLEDKSFHFEFEYIGYEVKSVKYINKIFLMVNPDPSILKNIPPNSLVISHHKISIYKNSISKKMLKMAEMGQLIFITFI